MESDRSSCSSSRTKISFCLLRKLWGGPPRPAAVRRAGRVDIQSFFGIKGTEIIRNGAAERIPAERFRTGLKVSAAGRRPMFPRRREAEMELPIPFLSEPETKNHQDFPSTCKRYCRSGDKAAPASPANRNRDGPELLPVPNWSLLKKDSKKCFVS